MNYRRELERHELLIQQLQQAHRELERVCRQATQAILEADAAFRSAGLSAEEGVGSLPSPSEDLSPAEQSADASATIPA